MTDWLTIRTPEGHNTMASVASSIHQVVIYSLLTRGGGAGAGGL